MRGYAADTMKFIKDCLHKTRIIIAKYGMLICLKYFIWYFEKYILRKDFTLRKVQRNKMYLDLRTAGISKELAIWGIREAPNTILLKEELWEGMVVADIGANIGYYALIEASIVKGSGRVYAFEPDLRNIEILKKNIEINGYANVVDIYNMAVSDRSGVSKLYLADETNLNTMLAPERVDVYKKHSWQAVEVKSVPLDDFLKGKRPVNFIRMDVEGFEVEILKGMMDTIKNAAPKFKISFELHMHTYYLASPNRMESVLRRLFELGLKAKVLIPDKAEAHKYEQLGYKPDRILGNRFYTRGLYYNIKEEDVIRLTCYHPNSTKFILLEKA